jgi:cobalamin biosynthesis protein CobT
MQSKSKNTKATVTVNEKEVSKYMISKSVKNKKDVAKKCDAGVKINVKQKVNDSIMEGTEVYKVVENQKTFYYKQCSLNVDENSSFCKKHANDCSTFSEIQTNGVQMSKVDLLDIKKKNETEEDDGNKNPVIILNVTQNLKNKIKSLTKTDQKVDDKKVDAKKVDDKKVDAKKVDEKKVDDKKKSQSSDDKKKLADEVKSSDKKDDASEEEGEESEEITTDDGKIFHLVGKEVYDLGSNNEGSLVGELVEISDKNPTVIWKGDNYIIGKSDIKENDIEYTRCVYTNKLYKYTGTKLMKVGMVEKTKNGTYKVKLDKK